MPEINSSPSDRPPHPPFRYFRFALLQQQQYMASSNTAANVGILSPPIIDIQSFSLWLSGLTPQIAADRIIKIDFGEEYDSKDKESARLYREETVDRFRTYFLLENSLKTPRLLNRNRYLFSASISEVQKRDLVSKYYSFDSRVFRHFLGRKLTNKFQKDLDDVRDEVGIPLRSVRRQFDNLRRVFDFYDDVGDNVVMTTQTLLEIEYFLPDHLSRAYSCALFLLVHRFQLQISKKKYQLLTWEDCCFVAEQIMLHWLQRPAFNKTSLNIMQPTKLRHAKTESLPMINFNRNDVKHISAATIDYGEDISKHSNNNNSNDIVSQLNIAPRQIQAKDRIYSSTSVEGRGRINSDRQSNIETQFVLNRVNSSSGTSLRAIVDDTDVGFLESSTRGNARNRRGALDLDGAFLSNLRDLKNHIFIGTNSRNDTDVFRKLVMYDTNNKQYKWARRFLPKFRSFLKSLMQIALGLNTQKEFRDLFEDLLDDICAPLNHCKFSHNETKELFESLLNAMSKLKSIKNNPRVKQKEQLLKSWKKYIFVMGAATVRCMGSCINSFN